MTEAGATGAVLPHLIYAALWLAFGASHSLLCGEGAKAALGPLLGAGYRLAYNGFALICIGVVFAVGYLILHPSLFQLSGTPWGFGLLVVQIAGLVFGLIALRGYDLGRFAGTEQLRRARAGLPPEDDEPLRIEGLNRYLRHPLYLAAYLILWGGAVDDRGLATALWGSVYLWLGARFEERRLLARYGQAYAEYRDRTPSVIPGLSGWGR
ncbi:MAG: methyltransferase family protein [Magnetovibrionaceae bacterium]